MSANPKKRILQELERSDSVESTEEEISDDERKKDELGEKIKKYLMKREREKEGAKKQKEEQQAKTVKEAPPKKKAKKAETKESKKEIKKAKEPEPKKEAKKKPKEEAENGKRETNGHKERKWIKFNNPYTKKGIRTQAKANGFAISEGAIEHLLTTEEEPFHVLKTVYAYMRIKNLKLINEQVVKKAIEARKEFAA